MGNNMKKSFYNVTAAPTETLTSSSHGAHKICYAPKFGKNC